MDHQSDIKISADHVVFTSVRSPMGEGYRIVAASSGVRLEERTEITQHCPSHGGLCEEDPSFVGLLSFRLSSGRYGIGHCSYAGTEHTGRGGNRVYTHLAVLDRSTFGHWRFDPVLVHWALGHAIGGARILNSVPRLAPIELTVQERNLRPPFQINHVCRIIAGMLTNQRMIVSGAPAAMETLQWLIAALPLSMREALSVGVGLKFSLGRHIQLSFISHDSGETRRILQGHDIPWLDMEAPLPRNVWPVNGWMDLVQRRWQEGRYNEIARFSDTLTENPGPANLDRIASILNDIDQVRVAHSPNLEHLIIKYAGFEIQNNAELELLRSFRTEAKSRAAYLQMCRGPVEEAGFRDPV